MSATKFLLDTPRAVHIHFDVVDRAASTPEVNLGRIYEAIGYLSTWSPNTYPVVHLYQDGPTDIAAIYHKPDGSVGYAIGAIWNGEKYGFHS